MFSQLKPSKGSLVLLDPKATENSLKYTTFTFQYNPDKLTRTFTYGPLEADAPRNANAQTTPNVPAELINLVFELDDLDNDQKQSNQSSPALGLHPSLAMLELMMQPQAVEGYQMELPVVLFSWGAKRLVPVRIVSMSVEEKTFDVSLNPTRVNVTLCMRVLDRLEFKINSLGHSICVNRLNLRTTLAEAYKQQTGQTVAAGTSAQASASGSGTASGAQSKPKKVSKRA